MFALLLVVFIVVPIAELYVIIKVGETIGVLPTIALLLLDSVLGAWLARSQGRAAWARLTQALEARRVPTKEVADGALIVFGGALLLTPGFITDVLGMLLLLPPTRAIIRGILARIAKRRMALGQRVVFWHTGPTPSDPGESAPGSRPFDVEGTADEVGGEFSSNGDSSGTRPPALPP